MNIDLIKYINSDVIDKAHIQKTQIIIHTEAAGPTPAAFCFDADASGKLALELLQELKRITNVLLLVSYEKDKAKKILSIPIRHLSPFKELIRKSYVAEKGTESNTPAISSSQVTSLTISATHQKLIKVNKRSAYANTSEGKAEVLLKLENRYKIAEKQDARPLGNKNLIYYTAAGNNDWLKLLKMSLESLASQDYHNFDVLLITTKRFKKEISAWNTKKKLNIYFFLVDEPEDGIAASINKLLIYKYKNIAKYSRVLFLDSDTIVVRSLEELFTQELDSTRFYTAWSSGYVASAMYEAHLLPFHGIGVLDYAGALALEASKQIPFNAGQYLFIASRQMLKHFENIHWLAKNWPGEYFFEQAFMTHYFCTKGITESETFDKYVNLYTFSAPVQKNVTTKQLNDPQVCIYHFIGKSTEADSKISFIETFFKEYAATTKT